MPDVPNVPEGDGGTITVTGKRPSGIFDFSKFWDWNWGGTPINREVRDNLSGGGRPAPAITDLSENEGHSRPIKGFSFVARFSEEFWNALTPQQQAAMNYLLDNPEDSPKFFEILQHYENEKIGDLRFEWGTEPVIENPATIPPQNWIATVDVWYEGSAPDGNLQEGKDIIITFNSEFWSQSRSIDYFMETLIHEILHPFYYNPAVPDDDFHNSGFGEELMRIMKEFFGTNELVPASFGPVAPVIESNSSGLGVVGSYNSDSIFGSTLNDVLAGMIGDDYLYGGGGNDILLGGAGNDILVSGVGSSVLEGGTGDDVYYASGQGSSFIIEDDDGFDRVVLPGELEDYTMAREGDDLVFWSDEGQFAIQIINHFVAGHEVEQFEFQIGRGWLGYSIETPHGESQIYDFDSTLWSDTTSTAAFVPIGFMQPIIEDSYWSGTVHASEFFSRSYIMPIVE